MNLFIFAFSYKAELWKYVNEKKFFFKKDEKNYFQSEYYMRIM